MEVSPILPGTSFSFDEEVEVVDAPPPRESTKGKRRQRSPSAPPAPKASRATLAHDASASVHSQPVPEKLKISLPPLASAKKKVKAPVNPSESGTWSDCLSFLSFLFYVIDTRSEEQLVQRYGVSAGAPYFKLIPELYALPKVADWVCSLLAISVFLSDCLLGSSRTV